MTWPEQQINNLCNLDLSGGFGDTINSTLSAYNSVVNSSVVSVMRDSTFVIGSSMLIIFMLSELITLVYGSNNIDNGIMGIKLPVNLLIKFGFFSLMFVNIPTLLEAIESIAVSVGSHIAVSGGYGANLGVSASQVAEIGNAIDSLSFWNKIFTYVTLFFVGLIVWIIKGICTITIAFRYFELWLLLMFSPIPLSTIASREFKQTGINFLKTFIAVSLQGSVILGCFMIYRGLVSASSIHLYAPGVDVGEFISTFIMENLIYAFVLAISVFTSGRIAKQIMNAI